MVGAVEGRGRVCCCFVVVGRGEGLVVVGKGLPRSSSSYKCLCLFASATATQHLPGVPLQEANEAINSELEALRAENASLSNAYNELWGAYQQQSVQLKQVKADLAMAYSTLTQVCGGVWSCVYLCMHASGGVCVHVSVHVRVCVCVLHVYQSLSSSGW